MVRISKKKKEEIMDLYPIVGNVIYSFILSMKMKKKKLRENVVLIFIMEEYVIIVEKYIFLIHFAV